MNTLTPPVKRTSRFSNVFRSLRHRNYKLWFFGQTISLIGSWMQTMAQQVLVYRLTGSAAALGMVNFVALIPLIPLSLLSGSISDRFPKRSMILLSQLMMLIQAILLAGLTWSGSVQVWHVYLLSFFLGAAQAIDLPARQAFTVDLVEGKEDLTNAIGLNSAMFNTARALGPALAGIVVAATGEAIAFLLNAITFIAVIISLLMMRNLPQSSHPVAKGTSTISHLAEGFRFLKSQPSLIVLFSLIAVSAFLSMPYNTLMPVFADNILAGSAKPVVDYFCDAQTGLLTCQSPEALPLGILLASVGIGAVAGAFVVASLPEHAGRGKYLTLGNIGFPLSLLLFSLSRSFVASLVLMLFIGFSFVWQNSLANTLLQLLTPDDLRARVMSLYTTTFQGMTRLGSLQAGYMGDWFGAPFAIGLGAVISLAYGVFVVFRFPSVRKMH
jgi:MFS family permease